MPSSPTLSPRAIREIAHELRSPLGGFEAMLDLLAATPLSPDQARLVEALEASAQHLRAILARILPPHAEETREVPRLGALIEAIVASASARAERKGLVFVLNLDPAVNREAEIDALGLRQVLENLIDNAIRMTPAGRITLDIASGAGGRMAFRLTDSGPGLDPARAKRLMAASPGQRGKRGGLGLGIAARLVESRGGKLAAERLAPGPGTAFTFDWPPAPPRHSESRLLIVDDHPASRLVLRTILSALGFPCEEAASAGAALERLRVARFAAVFTDLQMPEGGGRRLIEQLGAQADRPAVVIASADDPREEAGLTAGFDAAIRKPLTVPAVIAVLRQLGLTPGARQAA